jgi:mono/diheme cytochrome c family protein
MLYMAMEHALRAARQIGALLAVAAACLLGPSVGEAGAPLPDLVAKGKYLFAAAGGCGCHTEPGKAATGLNAGGRKFDAPFGTVYATNITPDRQTGIGAWTDQQIIDGIRLGRRPHGERVIPVHPFMTFNGLAAEDLRALVAYLRSLPPISRPNLPKQITVPLFESVFLPGWLAAFTSQETPIAVAPTMGPARGEYLTRVVGHCGECHTPRGVTQAVDNARFLAGNPKGPENSVVPNITPDKDTGLTWSEEQIAEYLGTGNTPDGDVAGGIMAEVITGTSVGYKDMTRADLLAVARYLKTVPPIKHKIK